MVSYCLNDIEKNAYFQMVDAECSNSDKCVSVYVVKGEYKICLPFFLGKDDLHVIQSCAKNVFDASCNISEMKSKDGCFSFSVQNMGCVFQNKIEIIHNSFHARLYIISVADSFMSFVSGSALLDENYLDIKRSGSLAFHFYCENVYFKNEENTLQDSGLCGFLDGIFVIQCDFFQLWCDRKGLLVREDIYTFYKNLQSFIENKTDANVFINNYSDEFNFKYKDEGIFMVGYNIGGAYSIKKDDYSYCDGPNEMRFSGWVDIDNIISLRDQLELLLKNNGFLR